jgi:hypothetical protein
MSSFADLNITPHTAALCVAPKKFSGHGLGRERSFERNIPPEVPSGDGLQII